jgi:hypothetical protein
LTETKKESKIVLLRQIVHNSRMVFTGSTNVGENINAIRMGGLFKRR